jgi:hypothetical protein
MCVKLSKVAYYKRWPTSLGVDLSNTHDIPGTSMLVLSLV